MNIRTPLAALVFCLASTVAFAAPQASSAQAATKPATTASAAMPEATTAKPEAAKTAAVKHHKKLECKKDETLVKGKCEPKKIG